LRIPIIGGNWKMNKTVKEAVDMVEDLKQRVGNIQDVEIVIFPPFTALKSVGEVVKGTNIGLGAQNMYWEEEGAYTGEISPLMILDIGCRYVILGHSERRQYFKETNEEINKKLKVALSSGITPVVCVGEKIEERRRGKAKKVVEEQIKDCFKEITLEEARRIVIAYEPVWAIGTGETATPEQAEEMHLFIRNLLKDLFGEEISQSLRIQYGGSVKPANIEELMKEKDIDGALVGGASLKADSFAEIIKKTAEISKISSSLRSKNE